MYFDQALELKRDLAEQIIFKKRSAMSYAFETAHGSHARKSFRKDLFKNTNGLSVVNTKDGGFALKLYLDGKVSEHEISSYLDLKKTEIILANIGVISIKTKKRRRPAWPGCSVGHCNGYAGSIGCILEDDKDQKYILSNNHVIANSNNARVNDAILQPGVYDGGRKMKNEIAQLFAFEKIDFTNSNVADWAIGKLIDSSFVRSDLPIFGSIMGYTDPEDEMQVFKYGRTTKDTYGEIATLSADIKVKYGNRIAVFQDQMEIVSTDSQKRRFSREGDSGSVVIDQKSNKIVGLLFAGGTDGTTFANDINVVFNGVESNLPNFTIA
jgi:hypothetical protein